LVHRVIDGDTVELSSGERIRYLMVDAPETTQGHEECYGAEARAANRSWVEQRHVELRYDEQCRDRFGRLLAYVFVDGREINTALIERGYARVLHIPPNGEARAAEFEALQRQAESQRLGLWGCPEAP
jgi:micrococcal nuclease